MREFLIEKSESGQTLIKYLARLMKEAPQSFFYKMLRKKNITLNGKKADGHEMIKPGDVVKIFVSEDTFSKFEGSVCIDYQDSGDFTLDIIYEDENIALINKPAGILSQKSRPDDVSINEYCISYFIKSGSYNPIVAGAFKPSVCNRLDRNTTGILLVGKSLLGTRAVNVALHDRTLHKYYVCPVKGVINDEIHLKGFLDKDHITNKVEINKDGRGCEIETVIKPLRTNGKYSLIEVELLTGKSHQIRAHLASIGHPLLGDNKYGDFELNKSLKLRYQLLHSYKVIMPDFDDEMSYLSGRVFETGIPDIMNALLGD